MNLPDSKWCTIVSKHRKKKPALLDLRNHRATFGYNILQSFQMHREERSNFPKCVVDGPAEGRADFQVLFKGWMLLHVLWFRMYLCCSKWVCIAELGHEWKDLFVLSGTPSLRGILIWGDGTVNICVYVVVFRMSLPSSYITWSVKIDAGLLASQYMHLFKGDCAVGEDAVAKP